MGEMLCKRTASTAYTAEQEGKKGACVKVRASLNLGEPPEWVLVLVLSSELLLLNRDMK